MRERPKGKWIVLGGLVVLAAIVAATPSFLDWRLRALLTDRAATIGATITYESIDLSLVKGGMIEMRGLRIVRDVPSSLTTIECSSAGATVDLGGLFTGTLNVEVLAFDAPSVRIVLRSIPEGAAPTTQTEDEKLRAFHLGDLTVEGGSFVLAIETPAGTREIRATDIHFHARDVSAATMVELFTRSEASATLEVAGTSAHFETHQDPPGLFLRRMPLGWLTPAGDAIEGTIDVDANAIVDPGGVAFVITLHDVAPGGALAALVPDALRAGLRIAERQVRIVLTDEEIAAHHDLTGLMALLAQKIMQSVIAG